MGKAAFVTFKDSEITLSMVKWSAIRKVLLVLGRKSGIISRFSPTLFVPSHECAVYDGGPRQVFQKTPYIIFYFANKNTAQMEFEKLRGTLQNYGLYGGLSKYIRQNIENRNIGSVDHVNFREELLRLTR